MSGAVTTQDYLYAAEIAYLSDPFPAINKFMPQYQPVEAHDLGNGFHAVMMQARADGHYLCAFRGTLPDVKGTMNHFLAYYGDALAQGEGAVPTASQLKQYQSDYDAWAGDPMIQDLMADSEIFMGKHVEQFVSATQFIDPYYRKSAGQPLYVTGHSLGGGIADYVAGARSGINAVTFAAPGYKNYGRASAATTINYYNANDTVPCVNLKEHCGALVQLDVLHSSFALEHQLGLRSEVIYGFNGTPDVNTAMTAHSDKAVGIVMSSLGFLIARLIYHQMPNYAGWLGVKSITGKTTKYTIQDFANAARDIIAKLKWVRREYEHPLHGIISFELRVLKSEGHLVVEMLSAYGKAMVQMGPYGYGMMPY